MIRALRCAAVLLAVLWAFGVEETAAQSSVSSVAILTSNAPASGDTYGRGERIIIGVQFANGAVTVGANTTLDVQIGSATRQFTRTSVFTNAVSFWNFDYTVQAGDSDTDGIRVQSLTGTITRSGGGSVNRTLEVVPLFRTTG